MPIACRKRHLALQQRHAAVERQAPDPRLRQAEASPRRRRRRCRSRAPSRSRRRRAWPLTRAITGTSSVSRSAMPPKPPGRGSAQYSSPLAPLPPFMSAPVAEGALAGAGQHHARARRGRARSSLQIVCSSRFGRRVDGVEHLGPVDRDAGDVVRRPRRGSASRGRSVARAARSPPAPPRCAGRARPAGCGRRPAHRTCGSGEPTTRTRLDRGSAPSRIMPLIARLLVASASRRSRTGAHSRSCSSSRASQCAVRVGPEALAEDRAAAPALLRELQRVVAKRGSSCSAGRSERGADVAQRIGLERADHHQRAVGGLEDAGERHRAPVHLAAAHHATSPPPASAWRAWSRSSDTLTCWPRPVFSRCSSASRMPCTRCMPAE